MSANDRNVPKQSGDEPDTSPSGMSATDEAIIEGLVQAADRRLRRGMQPIAVLAVLAGSQLGDEMDPRVLPFALLRGANLVVLLSYPQKRPGKKGRTPIRRR